VTERPECSHAGVRKKVFLLSLYPRKKASFKKKYSTRRLVFRFTLSVLTGKMKTLSFIVVLALLAFASAQEQVVDNSVGVYCLYGNII